MLQHNKRAYVHTIKAALISETKDSDNVEQLLDLVQCWLAMNLTTIYLSMLTFSNLFNQLLSQKASMNFLKSIEQLDLVVQCCLEIFIFDQACQKILDNSDTYLDLSNIRKVHLKTILIN